MRQWIGNERSIELIRQVKQMWLLLKIGSDWLCGPTRRLFEHCETLRSARLIWKNKDQHPSIYTRGLFPDVAKERFNLSFYLRKGLICNSPAEHLTFTVLSPLPDSSPHQSESGCRREPASETSHLRLGHGGLSRRCGLVPALCHHLKRESGLRLKSWVTRSRWLIRLFMASAWRNPHVLERTVALRVVLRLSWESSGWAFCAGRPRPPLSRLWSVERSAPQHDCGSVWVSRSAQRERERHRETER